MIDQLAKGMVLEFEYPTANYFGARLRWERRRLRVESVRDLAAAPLDPLTLTIDPQLRRGRWLVTGVDLDRGAERSFYLESMRDMRSDGPPAAFGEPGHAVAWIHCDDEWRPGMELPDEFEIVDVLAKDVSEIVADVIADGANQYAAAQQGPRRWAVVLPPGWLS